MAIIGGVIIFACALALSSIRSDKARSASEIFDIFFLGGLVTFLLDLLRAISDGVQNRSSDAFPLVILLSSGLAIFALGALLVYAW